MHTKFAIYLFRKWTIWLIILCCLFIYSLFIQFPLSTFSWKTEKLLRSSRKRDAVSIMSPRLPACAKSVNNCSIASLRTASSLLQRPKPHVCIVRIFAWRSIQNYSRASRVSVALSMLYCRCARSIVGNCAQNFLRIGASSALVKGGSPQSFRSRLTAAICSFA